MVAVGGQLPILGVVAHLPVLDVALPVQRGELRDSGLGDGPGGEGGRVGVWVHQGGGRGPGAGGQQRVRHQEGLHGGGLVLHAGPEMQA